MQEEPRYGHDCTNCVYLGHYGVYDLYVCSSGKRNSFDDTIIARWGEGGDYSSGIPFRFSNSALGEAFVRACARGLLNKDDYPAVERCKCGVLKESTNNEPCVICRLMEEHHAADANNVG